MGSRRDSGIAFARQSRAPRYGMDRGLNSSASPAFGLIVKAIGFCVLLMNSCALYGSVGVTLGFPDARSVSILSLSLLTIYCALNFRILSPLPRMASRC